MQICFNEAPIGFLLKKSHHANILVLLPAGHIRLQWLSVDSDALIQAILFSVFQDFLGQTFCTLGEIIGSTGGRLERTLS